MANDDYNSHRKHRQSSSPDEVEKYSKRHKHHRHHRHRHGSKKHNEVNKRVSEDIESSPPSVDPIRSSMIGSSCPDDDVEEGEILDEEAFGGGVDVIQEKKAESLAGYTEIEDVGVRDQFDKWNLNDETDNGSPERQYRKSRTLGKDHNDDLLVCNSSLEKEAKNQHNETGNELASRVFSGIHVNGDLDYQSRIEEKRTKESGSPSGGRSERIGYGDDGKAVGDASKLGNTRRLSTVRTRDKYKTRILSPSPDRYHAELPDRRKRSRSILYEYDHARERSRPEGVMEEEALLKRRSYCEKDVLEDERVVHHCDVADSLRDDDRDHSSSYIAQYAVQEHRHGSREASDREISNRERSRERDVDRDRIRERDVDRDQIREREVDKERRREKNRARSREREVDSDRRRETRARSRDKERSRQRELDRDLIRQEERARSSEKEIAVNYRREMEQERSRDRRWESVRDSSKDTYQDRDKKREKESDRSYHRVKTMDRSRDSERERETERNRHSDRIMDRTRERRDDQGMGKEREKYEGCEVVHRNTQYRNSRHDVKVYSLEKSRDEDEQEDYEESATLHPDQERDDLDRIKEESRRRKQAILEKYKKQQMQQETESKLQSKEAEKDRASVVHSSQPAAISTAFPEVKTDDDIFVAEPSLSMGKSPPPNGVAAFGSGGLGEGSPKSERLDNNFCDDIFGETPTGVRKCGKENGLKIERSGLNDNWDDAEGYYSYRFGELLDGRYEITAAHGKGVFSTVVRAKNLKAANGEPEEVAVKVIRSNDTMYKAGMTELVILKKLAGQDPENKRHCVRFLSSFKYRNHLCLVFESLYMNLREVLKKFGRNIGLKLTAVRAYAKQLFIALKHLKNCGVLHCDIKPDNMLVNEAKNVLKLCDFGNAMFAGKNEITPYLVSRFYRAPEIILGLPYDHPLDIWSVGCCLYELYTGKVLFPGSTNNDMLRLHMELKGPFPKKMLRKGAFIDQHFDHDLNFHATEEDPVTKKAIKRLILNLKPKDIGSIITGSAGEDPKMLADFKDLLDKIFILDPDKRLTASQALSHPFITVLAWVKSKGDIYVEYSLLAGPSSGMYFSIDIFYCFWAIPPVLRCL